jgi:hypothetical protein
MFYSGNFDRSLVAYQASADESGMGSGVKHVSLFLEVALLQLPGMARKPISESRHIVWFQLRSFTSRLFKIPAKDSGSIRSRHFGKLRFCNFPK